MGSNRGTFVQRCQAATWLSGTGWPWCAAFVCLVAKELGVPLVGANSAGAHDLANRHTATKVSWANVKPGMVVDYNLGSGHTGIVTHVDHARGTLTSIDGNYRDAVTEHTQRLADVRGFWAIPGVSYGTTPAPTPAPKRLPAFQVTTSVNGHRKLLFQTSSKTTLTTWMLRHTLARLAPNGITIHRGPAR